MTEPPISIQPKRAPLSHLKTRQRRNRKVDPRLYLVGAAIVVVLLIVINFADTQLLVEPPAGTPIEAQQTNAPGTDNTTPALPFATAQQKLARERAQTALAGFVEQQIQLEAEMQVNDWGQAELNAALSQAEQGDLFFAREAYDEAITAYEQATQQLAELVNAGHNRVQQLITDTEQALQQQRLNQARATLTQIRTIAPEHPELPALAQRIERAPQVIDLMRTAKNHELAERYDQALATYREVGQLDPQVAGLDAAIAGVEQAAERHQITSLISSGFAALERQEFDAARADFNAVLRLDPDDSIARGGLQQVARDNDLAIIARHRAAAEAALAAENWTGAIEAYAAILAIDKNIQFANTGLASAKAHDQADKLLTAINAEPTRLSSQSLYLQAQEILDKAQQLEHRGKGMNQLIASTQALLSQYKDPVTVQLISDNRTDVVVSNVGRLGYFEQKELSLRPGQYTIRGSQDGCRDLYLSVLVVPGVAPIDLRCQEQL